MKISKIDNSTSVLIFNIVEAQISIFMERVIFYFYMGFYNFPILILINTLQTQKTVLTSKRKLLKSIMRLQSTFSVSLKRRVLFLRREYFLFLRGILQLPNFDYNNRLQTIKTVLICKWEGLESIT